MKNSARLAALTLLVASAYPIAYTQAADESTARPIYQETIDRSQDSYPGEISNRMLGDSDNIRVVRRNKVQVVRRDDANSGDANSSTVVEDLPTRIDADHMKYTDASGDVFAEGNVVVVKGNRQLEAPRIEGNTRTGEYQTVGTYRMKEDGGKTRDFTGENMHYNSITGAMSGDSSQGYNNPYYFGAEDMKFDGQDGIIKRGWVTTKNAMAFKHTPDYRVTGDNIEIHPGDKAVIHHASFWIKNTRLFSLPKYTVSLRKDKEGKVSIFSLMPRPIYSSDNGVGIRGDMEIPVGKSGEAYFNYKLYTKKGLIPDIGYRQYFPWGIASLGYSKEEGTLWDETVWIKKEPELAVKTNTYHLGDSPMTVRGEASLGRWVEGNTKGAHNLQKVEFSHDPIKLGGEDATLRFFGGYQRDYYAYNGLTRKMPYWGVDFKDKITNRLVVNARYIQRNMDKNNESPYEFDTIEIPRNFSWAISYSPTRLDTFTYSTQTNVETGKLEYRDYTWHRDLHSFDAWLTYRSIQKDWKFMVEAKDF